MDYDGIMPDHDGRTIAFFGFSWPRPVVLYEWTEELSNERSPRTANLTAVWLHDRVFGAGRKNAMRITVLDELHARS